MGDLQPSGRRPPPPPPLPRRCNGSSLDPHSNMPTTSKEGNTSMIGGKVLYLNSRTRPYYSRRCKMVRSTNIESLPNELLFDILVRLPADDVYKRAGVVCRRWYHIIHSDAFVNTHLHHSTYGLVLSQTHHSKRLIYVSATEQGRTEISKLSCKCRTAGSCNGLVLELKKNSQYILNPATKQTFLLPPFDSDLVYGSCFILYSEASMEYKVVLTRYPQPRAYFYESIHLAILTVGVDNSWRHVQFEHGVRSPPWITEGFMHWVAGSSAKVLTLNVETEIITESDSAPLPQSYNNVHYLPMGRYLTLLIYHLDLTWEVWELKPETGEWRKSTQFYFVCDHAFIYPVGWVKYPEVLAFGVACTHTLIVYNLQTHEIESTTELPNYCTEYAAFPHRNTLVRLS